MEFKTADQVLQVCGRFQITIAFIVYLPKILVALCLYFMAFGAYNPGWRCKDDGTSTHVINRTESQLLNTSGGVSYNASAEFLFDSCEAYKACEHVEFNTEISTIVTEWGLICDRAWVTSFIISIQMAGLPFGTLAIAYCGDRFGRKAILYVAVIIFAALNVLSMFSASWQMFAILRFFSGLACGVMAYGPYILISEFLPNQWRAPVQSIPYWNIGMLIFCLCAMTTQNWYTIHLIITVMSFIIFLPCFWVPESLRWLTTNGKEKQSLKVAKKVAKMNGIYFPCESLKEMFGNEETEQDRKKEKYSMTDLFRRRLKFTLILGFCFFTMDSIYFATNFGVSVYPGNIYVNMIILSASELPSNVLSSFVPNLAGRRKSTVSTCMLCSCCFLGAAFMDLFSSGRVRVIGIMSMIAVGKIFLNMSWYILSVQTVELYPTVLRSTASGYVGLMAGLGSVVAPYLIPGDSSGLYITYITVSVCLVVCGSLVLILPETKGKPLSDTWEDGTEVKVDNERPANDDV